MSLVLQEVVKIPKMVNFRNFEGERIIQLPDDAKITVKSNRGNVYQVPITRKTSYNPEELMDRSAKFNAQVDVDKWTVYSIHKDNTDELFPEETSEARKERLKEFMALGGDY